MEIIKEYIKPELLILIPVMYIIAEGIKKTEIKSKFIPLILGVVSIMLSALYVVATSELGSVKDVLLSIFAALTQGILIAGTSVYANQLYKQAQKTE